MAVVQNPIIGRARGSVATTTFTTWKGLNVIKAKPISVSNPQSEGQLKQRGRLSFVSKMSRKVRQIIRRNFGLLAVGKTTFNAFSSANFDQYPLVRDMALPFNNTIELTSDRLVFSPNNLPYTADVVQSSVTQFSFSVSELGSSDELILSVVYVKKNAQRPAAFDFNDVLVGENVNAPTGEIVVGLPVTSVAYVTIFQRATKLSCQVFIGVA